jgi:hypothetical protein
MAAIGTLYPTLMDVARRVDPAGKVDKIVEMLGQTNEILEDMTWIEGNLPTGHKTTIRTGLPDVTWRKLNYGVQPSKSVTAQVTDACGMLEAYAEVDKSLADLNGNTSEFRLSEDRAFLESMNQTMATTLFYGDTAASPEKFMGLAPRYNAYSATATNIGSKVIKGSGAASDNTSIWLVVWGPNTVHGIYPKGSKAGFSHQDLGEQTLLDAANGKYQGYRSHYKWDCGLTVRDWRYVVRIANIKTSTLVKNAATGDDLIDLMGQALELVQDLKMGKPVLYCNRTIKSYLRRQIMNKVASSTLTMEQVAGKPVMMFGEVPVKRVDQILNTEATLS